MRMVFEVSRSQRELEQRMILSCVGTGQGIRFWAGIPSRFQLLLAQALLRFDPFDKESTYKGCCTCFIKAVMSILKTRP